MSSFFSEQLNQVIKQLNNGNISDFARDSGIKREAISKWLHEGKKPSGKYLPLLLKYTGKPIDFFFQEEKRQDNISKISENYTEYQAKRKLTDSEIHDEIIKHLYQIILSDSRIKILEEKCDDLIAKVSDLEKKLKTK